MTEVHADLADLHAQFDLLSSIEVGLVVVDRDFNVTVWNQFMQNNSDVLPAEIRGKCLFDKFPEIDRDWFIQKAEPVFELQNPAFIIWEQRPYLFKFFSNRPITSGTEYMYQNVTLFPLMSLNGQVEKICIVIYDVTDAALGKKSIEALNMQLERISRIDGLTQLNNRRFWQEQFELEYKRARRSKAPISVLMMDIDHFKKVNDTYGHQAGDEVIRAVAAVIRSVCRETDFSGRYGGEEFAIVLPDTTSSLAKLVGERIRKTVEKTIVEYEGQKIQFTASVGIAEYDESHSTPLKWLEDADKALYDAKEGGRNQVKIHQ